MRQHTLHRACLAVIFLFPLLALSQSPLGAQTTAQELLLPFSAGIVEVQADETYEGNRIHPSIGEIAFDLTDVHRGDHTEMLAIGNGRARLVCVDKFGSAVVQFQADGYAGDFYYAHLDDKALGAGIDEEWSRVRRGQVIGQLFPSTLSSNPGDHCAQASTGAHLHFDLPRSGLVIDGIVFNAAGPNDGDHIVSTNRKPGERTSATCAGERATIVGTSGDDVLQGTPGRDVIAGLEGRDVVFGLGGNDLICGGRGADFLVGGDGLDEIYGARGNDTIIAANGSDKDERDDPGGGATAFGGRGNDVIFGSNQSDRIDGGPGDDVLTGYNGHDVISGGAGEDRLAGGRGEDRLVGGEGGDDLGGGRGADVIVLGGGDVAHGGASRDLCQFDERPAATTSCEVMEQR